MNSALTGELGSAPPGSAPLGSAELSSLLIGSLTARSLSDWWEALPAGARALALPWQRRTLRRREWRDPAVPPPRLSSELDQGCRVVVPTGCCVPVPTGIRVPVPTGSVSSSREAVGDG